MKKIDFFTQFQILFISFLLFSLSISAQVGIGTTSSSPTLDINETISFKGNGTLILTNANNKILI